MRKSPLPVVFAISVVAGAAAYFATRGPAAPIGAFIGSPAPDFTLSDLAGRPVSLSRLRGRPVLLNFWATWCDSCAEELPDLKALHAKLGGRGLAILAPSVDESGKKAVLPFVARFELPFPVLYCDAKTARAYAVRALPTSWLVAPDGTIAKKYVGPLTFAEVENDILKLIRRPS